MHRKYVRPLLAILALLLMACNLVEWPSSATPEESDVQTRVAQDVAATLSALPTPTLLPSPTHTPIPPTDTPTPPPPTATPSPPPTATSVYESIPATYVVEEERLIGSYTVRLWRNTAADSWGYDNIATISTADRMLVQIETVSGLGSLTGADLTGEGHPDVIVEIFTGGAHCCFSTLVYDLGPTLTKVLETPQSNCGGRFEDLDGDGVLEFVTCDDLFAYVYCAYAASPMVKVILQYEPGRGYVPASPRFAHLYAEDIAVHTRRAEGTEDFGDWDGTNKCAVLPLVLDYVYIGQADRAWGALNRLYHYPDRLLFWTEVVRAVADSPLYVAAGSPPVVPLPPYYMLQLLTNCGPDRRYVGLLTEGQSACDPAVVHRDVYWLDWELRQIGLLDEGEGLELVPEGCTLNCRLDVARHSDRTRQGSIRLDTTVGFPGAVYRVNGVESGRWRLRGDLTWERISP